MKRVANQRSIGGGRCKPLQRAGAVDGLKTRAPVISCAKGR